MASTIAALTSGAGGISMTGDASGILNLNSNGTTVVAVTSTGATVTGTLAATGAVSGTTGTFTSTLGVTGAITGSSTVAGSTGILYPLTSGTAVASTSGTSIDFTGIPSWVKRITFMLSGVSTNGASPYILRLGTSSGIVSTGYVSCRNTLYSSIQVATNTSGFDLLEGTAALTHGGSVIISNFGASNTWVVSGVIATSGNLASTTSGYSPNLAGTLDRIRLTTVNGTDTFDAGSVNILYE